MTTLQDVIRAYRAISTAEARYRETLRAALASGVRQTDVARELGRTREMIRRDAMTEEQREEFMRRDADRLKRRREEIRKLVQLAESGEQPD